LFLIAFLNAHGQTGGKENFILARVGRQVITEKEFQERFDLLPGPGRSSPGQIEAAKQDMLLSLVAEKLLANAAEANGLLRDTAITREIDQVRRLLARDELFRDEVQHKVKVLPSEIRLGVQRAKRRLLVSYLFSEDRTPLDLARRQIRRGMGLNSMSFDSTSGVLHDTITVDWGQAEAELENAAFAAKPGQVSPVIHSSLGWFVLQLLHEEPNPNAVGQGDNELRANVERILRLRKEEKRLEEFVASATLSFEGRSTPERFREIAEVLRTVFNAEGRCSPCVLDEAQTSSARTLLSQHLGDTLLVMGKRAMTVDDGLTRLFVSGTRIPSTERPELERSLNRAFRQWVLQDILESIALERGLDSRPEVARHIEYWQAHYLAEGLRAKIAASTSVTDPDVYAYAHSLDSTIAVPTLDLRIAESPVLTSIVHFHDALRAGASLDTILAYLSSFKVYDVKIRDLHKVPLNMAGAYGTIAWNLTPGTWSNPAKLDTVSVVVQLIRRYDPPRPPASVWDSLTARVREAKINRTLDVTIAGLARKNNVVLYDDVLPSVRVSSVPMMTYRILGFGGRMFAVPFVRPFTGWVDVESLQRMPIP